MFADSIMNDFLNSICSEQSKTLLREEDLQICALENVVDAQNAKIQHLEQKVIFFEQKVVDLENANTSLSNELAIVKKQNLDL